MEPTQPLRSLQDVNNILLQKLYTNICSSDSAEDLLNYTEAVAKLNSSFKNNDQVGQKELSEAELRDKEESSLFSSCAEGDIIDGN